MTEQLQLHDQARELFFQHQSFREIARQLAISHVTVARWAREEEWVDQLKRRELNQKEYEHQKYLEKLAEVKGRTLTMSKTMMEASLFALREYFLYDEHGNTIGVRKNHMGNPLIGPMALGNLVATAHMMELNVLGMKNGFPAPDVEKMVAAESPKTIEADPEFLKRLGDAAAKMTLEVPEVPDV